MTVGHEEPEGEARRSAPYVLVAVAALLIAIGLLVTGRDRPLPVFDGAGIELSDGAVTMADSLLSQPGATIASLDEHADAALAGYFLAAGQASPDGWTLDLGESGSVAAIAIERAMAGAFADGRSVERLSDLEIGGVGDAPTVGDDDTVDERVATLAALVEVSGGVEGTPDAAEVTHVEAAVALARSIGLDPRLSDEGSMTALVLDRLSDRATVASWTFACLDRVPLLGGRGCAGTRQRLAFASDEAAELSEPIVDWIAATTGPLDRRESHWLSPEQGGVGWTNGEAQQYRDTAVTKVDDQLTLTASPHPEAGVERAPFDSGMIISSESFGWGRVEVDLRLPTGSGLWPAVWLLDSEACSAPGVCEGYETPRYHEIDLLETSGGDEVSTSVHWFDERIRSLSITATQPVVDGQLHTIAIDRRPGLLVWSLDGVEIARVTGLADAGSGPHRAAPMRLVVNLAVGGTFAGDRLLGPTSPWWGSSIVPDEFPDLGWASASMTVAEARFTALDALLLG